MEKIDNKTHGLLDDCLSLKSINLSYNNIAFLTKKMFPSNPYIPYKLYEADLSHNGIAVATFDLTYGTKKLKKLNLAYNVLNEIRNHVLGNLTDLEYLDLSGNSLRDLIPRNSDGSFVLPAKITHLNISNNILETLPTGKIVEAPFLKALDVRYNKLLDFEPKLVQKIKDAGLDVYFEGNVLKCDCFIRPLKHYLNTLKRSELEKDIKYNNLVCQEPAALFGEKFISLDEERLLCAGNIESDTKLASYSNTDDDFIYLFVSEPDLAFRDIQ